MQRFMAVVLVAVRCGFGDDQGYVSVVNDHSGMKKVLHDFI